VLGKLRELWRARGERKRRSAIDRALEKVERERDPRGGGTPAPVGDGRPEDGEAGR
jgi:hypothetical protein